MKAGGQGGTAALRHKANNSAFRESQGRAAGPGEGREAQLPKIVRQSHATVWFAAILVYTQWLVCWDKSSHCWDDLGEVKVSRSQR